MTRSITELGPREVEFLAECSARGQLITTADARAYWGTDAYAWQVLWRLEAKGWLERLEKGSYMIIPLRAGTQRAWSEDALAVGTFLAPRGAAAYWTAMRHWNWTTQIPRTVHFITPQRRFNMRPVVLGVGYRFVLAPAAKVFGVAVVREGSLVVRVTDRERTVVDMMNRPDLCGGIVEVVDALREAWGEVSPERLTAYVADFASGTVPKRLGYLVEALELEPPGSSWVERWRGMIGAGYSPLDRGGALGGRHARRWNLIVNVGGFGVE